MAGRPPFFNSADDLETNIQEYFKSCEQVIVNGTLIQAGRNITITGLALYLGFESRQSFYDYEKHEEYSYIIKKARLRVESEYEDKLMSRNPAGPIFALKNMGWKDKQDVDVTTAGEKISFNGINIVKPDGPDTEVQA